MSLIPIIEQLDALVTRKAEINEFKSVLTLLRDQAETLELRIETLTLESKNPVLAAENEVLRKDNAAKDAELSIQAKKLERFNKPRPDWMQEDQDALPPLSGY